jgi:hypothetical protein
MAIKYWLVRGIHDDKTGGTIKIYSGEELPFTGLDEIFASDSDMAGLTLADAFLLTDSEALARGQATEVTLLLLASVLGTTADTVVAANAAGTLSAKLRRVTADLSALLAKFPTALTGAGSLKVAVMESLPGGTNVIGKVSHDVTTIADGRKDISTAGTREPIVATSTPAKWVIIQALEGNTGKVVIGGTTVVADLTTRRGIALAAGEKTEKIACTDLQNINADVTVSGEAITFIYCN